MSFSKKLNFFVLVANFLVFSFNGINAQSPASKSFRLLSWVGNIGAIQDLQIKAKTSGRITKIYVKENQKVKEGNLLMRLENDVQQIQVEISKQQVLLNQYKYKEAQINFDDIRRRLAEEKELYQKGSSTKTQFDSLKLQYAHSETSFLSAGVSLSLSQKEQQLREEAYRDTFVLSSLNGIVAKKYVTRGEIVGVGSILFQLLDIKKVEISVGASEEELPLLKRNTVVSFSTPAYPRRTFKGRIDRINWASDPKARRFPFYIIASNRRDLLRSGMTAKIEMKLK